MLHCLIQTMNIRRSRLVGCHVCQTLKSPSLKDLTTFTEFSYNHLKLISLLRSHSECVSCLNTAEAVIVFKIVDWQHTQQQQRRLSHENGGLSVWCRRQQAT